MAAVNFSPSGFSYAQAAKGRASTATSQAPSSKVTSGAATPATGTLGELTPGGNWADDVEASVGEKKTELPPIRQDESKSPLTKDGTVELAKSEEKQSTVSGVSSPDLAASSSTTTNQDDSSSAPNALSSESTWETKSQTSEPAWIAERKERQSNPQQNEKPTKSDKKAKEASPSSPPPSVALHDAPLPTVNPWQKRAEEAKAKTTTAPPKAAPAAPASEAANPKENQKPRPESRRKANSVASIPAESLATSSDDSRKHGGPHPKHASDARSTSFRQSAKLSPEGTRSDSPLAGASRGIPSERSSLPNMTAPPPSVRDEVSWPTPDTADKGRKGSIEKEAIEKREDEPTPTTKRKKQEWKPIPVVPTVIYETPSMNESKEKRARPSPGGEKAGRGGSGVRGRGGYRGTPNGTNGADRHMSRSTSSPTNQDSDAPIPPRRAPNTSDREAMAPPPRPTRSSSAGPRHGQKEGSIAERGARGQNFTHAGPVDSNVQDAAKPAYAATNGFSKSYTETRRTKSPKTTDQSASEEEQLPKPIPRRSSIGTQTEETSNRGDVSARDGPLIRMVPSDNKLKENAWAGAPRGGKRGGRGRGGNGTREVVNGHPAAHGYGTNYATDFTAAPPYGAPPSPSAYQGSRGNHHSTYPSPGRGGWRGNPRSLSTPFENYYNQQRFGAPYPGAQAQMPGIQPFVPGMCDMSGYPMSAAPYPQQVEPNALMNMVGMQIEYYFSIDNLLKDMFLRKHMDSQGFVYLDVVANFNRIKQLTTDKDLIRTVCISSEVIEIRVGEDGKERLRKREGWDQFLLPMEQREATAQNNGPEQLERPERPQISLNSTPPQFRGPASAGLPHIHPRYDRRSYDSSYGMLNGYPPHFAAYGGFPAPGYGGDMTNGEESRGRAAKSPMRENVTSPTTQPQAVTAEASDAEPDAFPDDQISVLAVVVKTHEQRPAYHSATSRTFSNGSIDSRNILAETDKPSEAKSQLTPNGEALVNGSQGSSDLSLHPSPSKTRSRDRTPANADVNVFWVKDQDYAVEGLPPGLTPEPYEKLRSKALDERNHAATGTCPYDLDVLYQFWCHFLLRNFNNRMYSEFKHYANEDANQRHTFTGLHNLVQFYSKSLLSDSLIRDRVVKDYVELVKNEPPRMEGAAWKQLCSVWRNGAFNIKNRKKLRVEIGDELHAKLEKLDGKLDKIDT
ncbi:hypothetical protein LTR37_015674 [Vermiconidia calcicola]|uniref:Uncharacterized protein n=1 Tax=Vermiconidia calcicola TaxID=1690605 RepID=A0ACC3MQC7_9PEZI|nr:hypothetical protein LTR37_015674 [Vermiconidia calcicola]